MTAIKNYYLLCSASQGSISHPISQSAFAVRELGENERKILFDEELAANEHVIGGAQNGKVIVIPQELNSIIISTNNAEQQPFATNISTLFAELTKKNKALKFIKSQFADKKKIREVIIIFERFWLNHFYKNPELTSWSQLGAILRNVEYQEVKQLKAELGKWTAEVKSFLDALTLAISGGYCPTTLVLAPKTASEGWFTLSPDDDAGNQIIIGFGARERLLFGNQSRFASQKRPREALSPQNWLLAIICMTMYYDSLIMGPEHWAINSALDEFVTHKYDTEAFASPLNSLALEARFSVAKEARLVPGYFSLNFETDKYFDSLGNLFTEGLACKGKVWYINPPFTEQILEDAAKFVIALLTGRKDAQVYFYGPKWDVTSSTFKKANFVAILEDSPFVVEKRAVTSTDIEVFDYKKEELIAVPFRMLLYHLAGNQPNN
jgi:hypothetical protein